MSLKNLAKLVNQATKELTVEQQFLQDLNSTIVKLDAADNRPGSKTYKPSMLGGCSREIFFLVEGFEEDVQSINPDDASFIGICESGTDRHERIQKAVAEMLRMGKDWEWIDVAEYLEAWPQPGTYVKNKQGMETKLGNKIFNMSFLCDGIVRHRKTGKYYVLEIKTEASFKWNGRVEPVDKHKYQATAYSVTLGIDDVLFIYENRDFCSKKSFHYHVTEEDKMTRVIGKIETIENYRATYKEDKEAGTLKHESIPPKSTVKSDCNYCDYKKVCKLWEDSYEH